MACHYLYLYQSTHEIVIGLCPVPRWVLTLVCDTARASSLVWVGQYKRTSRPVTCASGATQCVISFFLSFFLTTALLHCCTAAPLQCCTAALQHCCTAALQHCCTAAPLHAPLHHWPAALLPCCPAALLHHCAALLPCCTIAPQHCCTSALLGTIALQHLCRLCQGSRPRVPSFVSNFCHDGHVHLATLHLAASNVLNWVAQGTA